MRVIIGVETSLKKKKVGITEQKVLLALIPT